MSSDNGRINSSPKSLSCFSTPHEHPAEFAVLIVPQSYMMQSPSSRWCLGRQLASIHKQSHCQPKKHLPPDCQISTSPCAEEEAALAVLSRKHAQFCKLLVITVGFLLCKGRKRGALKLLQWMETRAHKRQLYSEFPRNIQAPKCGHQKGGPGEAP